jgi:hypothetical protein
LAKIIQNQCGHHHGKPSNTNGFFAKVAHVGIERFTTGDTEHHRTQNDESSAWVFPDKPHRIGGADGPQNRGVVQNMNDTQQSDDCKPHHSNRAKKLADTCCTTLLDCKQAEQNYQSEWNHVPLKSRRNNLQALNG